MHTKSFFPFYQGNKANTAPTEALCLLIALQQQPWQTLIQTGWCGEGSKAFPTAFKSGFVSAFAILGTMGLQQHAGFLKVVSTFWEKQHFFMGFARQRGNSAFSMSFFFPPPFEVVCETPPCRGELGKGRKVGCSTWMGHMCHSTPQHPNEVTERSLPRKQPRYVKASVNS